MIFVSLKICVLVAYVTDIQANTVEDVSGAPRATAIILLCSTMTAGKQGISRKILAQRTLIIDLQILTTTIRNEIDPSSRQRPSKQCHPSLLCLQVFEASQPIILVTWSMGFPKVT